jgi:hypothetical protein
MSGGMGTGSESGAPGFPYSKFRRLPQTFPSGLPAFPDSLPTTGNAAVSPWFEIAGLS